MIKILLSGCNGKMGQVITRLASQRDKLKIVAGFDISDTLQTSYPVYTVPDMIDTDVNVIIDFSNPDALDQVLQLAIVRKTALVMATTGLSQPQVEKLITASKDIPIFFSANMSLGVNLVIDLVKKAARVLDGNFDIEIIEKHHNQKLDAPSGTALAIADAIDSALDTRKEYVFDRHSRRKKRGKNEIGIHAIRGGTIVGDHSVIFAGSDEIIEINHTAMSKDIFGVGALRAAEFICNKTPGLYNMSDLIGAEEHNV